MAGAVFIPTNSIGANASFVFTSALVAGKTKISRAFCSSAANPSWPHDAGWVHCVCVATLVRTSAQADWRAPLRRRPNIYSPNREMIHLGWIQQSVTQWGG